MKLGTCIEGGRIRIRDYQAADKAFVCDMWLDRENGKYLSDPAKEYADTRYYSLVDTLQGSTDGYYCITEDIETGERIASCCAFFTEDGSTCDIGYCVHRHNWRCGYGTELVESLVAWAFSMGAVRITAEVAKENTASNRLLCKCGFCVERETKFKKYNMHIEYESYVYSKGK